MKVLINKINNKIIECRMGAAEQELIQSAKLFGILREEIEILEMKMEDYIQRLKIQEFNNLTYAQKRQKEYPDIYEYIDGVVKNDTIQIQNYITKCLAVKEKYPKV